MASVDIPSGLPAEVVERSVDANKLAKLEEQKGRADQLKAAIVSETGQAVLHKIEEHLLTRINQLIEGDGECKALKKLLVDIGVTMSIGQRAVDGLMRLVKVKQTP